LLQRVFSGNFMTSRLGWRDDYPVADNVLYGLFYGPSNGSGSFTKTDRQCRASCSAPHARDTARLTAYQSIDATVAADVR